MQAKKSPVILIADDDLETLEALSRLLGAQGIG